MVRCILLALVVQLAVACETASAGAPPESAVADGLSASETNAEAGGDSIVAGFDFNEGFDACCDFADESTGEACIDCCLDGPAGVRTCWARAEYLIWGSDGMKVPALATSSPTGTGSSSAGVIGATGTQVLFGDSRIADHVRSGGRFEIGAWLNPDCADGISLSYFFLADVSTRFSADQTSEPILARPFLNVGSNAHDARLINFAGLVEGSLQIEATSSLQSSSLDYRGRMFESPYGRFDCLLGYRFAQLSDNVTIREQTTSLSGATAGSSFELTDQFDVKNDFHGCEIGIASTERLVGGWSGDLVAKAALGGVISSGRVFGQTDVTENNVTSSSEGGLLALSSNIGKHHAAHFGAVWDLGLRLRKSLGAHTSLVVGYDWFLWTSVQRAGRQIDLGVNTTQIPPGTLTGESRPRYPFASSAYWAEGVSLWIETLY